MKIMEKNPESCEQVIVDLPDMEVRMREEDLDGVRVKLVLVRIGAQNYLHYEEMGDDE